MAAARDAAHAKAASGSQRHVFSRIRSPQDFAGGLFLIAVALFAYWQSRDLTMGTLRQLGPGMVPHILAVLLGLCGAVIALNAFRTDGPSLERWALRGPLFVFGAALLFAAIIRPLGLVVAGPLLIIVSGMASHETRWKETIVFGFAMTAFCVVLFRLVLALPIPLAPWIVGY